MKLTVNQALKKGVAAHKAGHFKEADRYYTAILKAHPKHPDANHNIGLIAVELGQTIDSLPFFEMALKVNPKIVQYWLSYINALINLNRFNEAEAAFSKAINTGVKEKDIFQIKQKLDRLIKVSNKNSQSRCPSEKEMKILTKFRSQEQFEQALNEATNLLLLFPNSVTLYNIIGSINRDLGKFGAAIKAYKKAIEQQPDYADPYYNLGNVLQNQGKQDQAIEAYKKAIRIKPDFAWAQNNIGVVLQDQGRLNQAVKAYKKAIEIQPAFADPYFNLGVVFQDQGKLDKAIKTYKKALGVKPDNALAYNNLGNALKDQGNLNEALDAYKKAIEIQPDYADPYYNLGNALRDQGKQDEAVKAYKKAIEIQPDFADACNNIGNMLSDQGNIEEAIEAYNRTISMNPHHFKAYSNLIFFLAQIELVDSKFLEKITKSYNKATSSKVKRSFHHKKSFPSQKLRVGFVSGDMRDHPVGYFLQNLFKYINKEKVEIYVYSNSTNYTKLTYSLKKFTAFWRNITNISDHEAAEIIYNDTLDVLIDLSGHTALNRLPVFAYKPCAIQASWLGYFGSTFLNEMDFIIGDSFVTPLEKSKDFYEKIALLEHCYLCFAAPNFELPVSNTPALENKIITFGCFNHSRKLNSNVISTWSRILINVEKSKLLLKGDSYTKDSIDKILHEFSLNNIDASQLMFEGQCSREDLLKSYDRVDISLDPFPYPGGTTTCEAIWMGVPTITMKGSSFLSSVGETIAVNSGHGNLCAETTDKYIELAVQLSGDISTLNANRLQRRSNVIKTPLFDGLGFAKDFQRLLEVMIEQGSSNA